MANFTIPYNKVSYDLGNLTIGGNQVNTDNFDSFWGASLSGDYGSDPYSFVIKSASLTFKIKNKMSVTGWIPGTFTARLRISSHKGTSTTVYDSVWLSAKTIKYGGGSEIESLSAGGLGNYTGGSWSGLNSTLKLHPEGGKLRGYLTINGSDFRLIWSSEYYPSDYTPVNPDMSINVGSDNVNNIKVSLNSSVLTDLSSYTYTFRLYSDSGRTQQVWSFTGNNISNFPYNWNGATPGTTYYWSLELSGVNSKTGQTLTMSKKTGTVTTMSPWVNEETLTYTASPTYNGHWTPRTIISYTISTHNNNEHATGLTFKNFEIQTALNGLQSNTKSHRVTALTGTLALTDTTKVLREVKPRDLFYMKVRVCCVDNANREYYSNWFGILTPQYIYNKFHVYLTTSSINQLRVNSKVAFSGKNAENYWNKGEVK